MNLQKTPIAIAAFALFAAAPFAAQAAPTVSFRAPAAGATISQPIDQSSACEVTGQRIRRVVFSIRPSSGGTWTTLNTEQDAPWQCNIDPARFASGQYTLRAVAYDRDSGGTSRTATRTINIQNGTTTGGDTGGGTANTPPTVSITAPASGATLSGTLNYAANATDSNGITQVQFFLDGATTALRTDTSSPYNGSINTTTLANGTHTLRAVATDSLGASTGTEVSFNVSNTTSNTPPAVSITAPANGATVGSTLNYAANASDSNGITQVQFFLDGATTALSTDTSSPYSGSVTLAPGTHTLRAVATDSLGATSSSQVSFTVQSTTSGGSTTGPQVSVTSPANGATVRGTIAYSASASDPNGIRYVQFFLDNSTTYIRNDTEAPFTGNLNTENLPDGTHTLRAVARARETGETSTTEVSFIVANRTTVPAPNAAPTVNLTAPTSGATLSGTAAPYSATASDTDGSVARVDFYLVDGSGRQTLIGSDTTNDYGGTFNTTQVANGTYTLMAVATDNAGASSTTQRDVTISNTVTPDPTPVPNPDPGSGGGATTLPANGARAVPTFESFGMYWRPSSNPGAAGCSLRYRKHSESAWREALAMWYDARNSECRGSIVHLEPGTDYAVEMGVGTNFSAGVNTRTWAENFPIARTVQVQSGSGTLTITEGGTPQGYVLYTGPATLDAANAADYNIAINAPYVIVRGLTLRGARVDAIRVSPAVTDVVIEDNDISGWGRASGQTVNGVVQGVDRDSAIRANCVNTPGSLQRAIIQRNRIHDPRYGANSWDGRIHPLGPVGIEISHCGGNHVIRYNEITGGDGHYYKDGMGGQANFSEIGFPGADTDIYGNIVTHTWDDGIEAEGGNRNVRIWGNYLDQTTVGIATTVVHTGPTYIFRNVYNRSRRFALVGLDADDRLQFSKSGSRTDFGNGRRYMFHNTLLQATQTGVVNGLGAGEGIVGLSDTPLTNTVSRNNILHVWRTNAASIRTEGGTNNDLDYDLRNGNISAYAGAEANGIVGTPAYRSGHGWANWASGNYQLDPSSPGYDRGVRIPNFNDAFTSSGPDMGAHEGDTPAMRLGTSGGGSTWAGSTGGGTTTGGTTTDGSTSSTTGTTTTTTSSGGVCSTVVCAATQ
jgi:hypothetical protein